MSNGDLGEAPTSWQGQLKQDLARIDAEFKEQSLEADRRRAAALFERWQGGKTQVEIALASGYQKSHVDRLLRYHRFLASSPPAGGELAEFRFRQYWRGLSDDRIMRTGRPPDPNSPHSQAHPKEYEAKRKVYERRLEAARDHEQEVFQEIERKLESGSLPSPTRHHRVSGPRRKKELSPKDIHSLEVLVIALRENFVGRIQEATNNLKGLLRSNKPTHFIQNALANWATTLETAYGEMVKLIDGLIKNQSGEDAGANAGKRARRANREEEED